MSEPAQPSPGAQAQWQQLADAVAARAARTALGVPGIWKTAFSIHGNADAPVLTARVRILRSAKFARAVDEVMEQVVPEMESRLGRAFAEHHIDFDLTGLGSSRRGASALTII
ncbi:hypothetical protein [Brachybacterium sp. UNK5269]|uniref:hypothetical protein n=1 Tax=Brachybacterium sp. UNK5269 TaxID=3408576 RepID=UPI003BB1928C